MPHRLATLLLLLATVTAACAAHAELGSESRTVVIHNPALAEVHLHRVERDGFAPAAGLGRRPTLSLQLPPGRYALSLDGAAPSVPLPLPKSELGYAAPRRIELTIRPGRECPAGWCWIPSGPTVRGDALGVGQEDERPLSTPHVGGFWLATTETTNAQYVAFLNAIDREAVDAEWLDLDGAKCRVQWDATAGRFATDAPDLPVVTVSWPGAIAYCAWLTDTTGIHHRLPTETEWEKAARGAGSRVYAYGDTCRTRAANQESGVLREVGQYAPNEYGLFDMTANAFEWCADAYSRATYAGEPPPTDPRALRVLRGGSFVLDGIFCRNAMRMRLRPDVRADDVGFRVLKTETEETR